MFIICLSNCSIKKSIVHLNFDINVHAHIDANLNVPPNAFICVNIDLNKNLCFVLLKFLSKCSSNIHPNSNPTDLLVSLFYGP